MSGSSASERGSVMINTLAVLAVAASVTMIMLNAQDGAIERARRYSDAGQATEIARGAEDSARAILRRDLEAPATWQNLRSLIEEQDADIVAGSFSLRIEDAQARFNINNLAGGGIAARGVFERLAAASGFQLAEINLIAEFVQAAAPLDDLTALSVLGIEYQRLSTLSVFVCALPERTDVNMNTAGEMVLAAHLNNGPAARALVMRRDRIGQIDRDILSSLRILPGPGLGYGSNYYLVEVEVVVGESREKRKSLIWRGNTDGEATTRILSRSDLPAPSQ